MIKIISLFKRNYEGNWLVYDEIVEGAEWVINWVGVATVKFDGTACMIKEGKFYKRYDVKKGRTPPEDGIPCEPKPDGITKHWPWWKPVAEGPEDEYHREALYWLKQSGKFIDGTYELIGPKIQGNHYGLSEHRLILHGKKEIEAPRTFERLKEWFGENAFEGVVWHDRKTGNMVKIKRKDFGYSWPVKEKSK